MMKKGKFALTFFGLLVFSILLAGVVTADTIFSDGFESGNILDNWVLTPDGNGNNWVAKQLDSSQGTWHAELNPATDDPNSSPANMTKLTTTASFESIVVNYKRKLVGIDSSGNDEFKAQYFIDGGWVDLESVTDADDDSYLPRSFPLLSASDKADFRIRFLCTIDRSNEFCKVDEVSITGTPISTDISITAPARLRLRIGQSIPITVKNLGTSSLSVVMDEITTFGASFLPPQFTLGGLGSEQLVNIITSALTGLRFGDNSLNIKADAGPGISDTATIILEKTFCSKGDTNGNLSISDFEVDNLGKGDDEEWQILDDIELTVEISNDGTETIDDIDLVLGFFDSEGNDLSDDFEWSSKDEEKFDLGNIRDDDEDIHIFKFRVSPEFANNGDDDYKLAVKAFSKNLGEEVECVDTDDSLTSKFFEPVSIILEDDDEKEVIVDDITLDNEQLICGETVSGEFTVFNLGEDDQDKVRIVMQNSELGLMQEFEVNNLDIGDDKPVQFSFELPGNIEAKRYNLEFYTEYFYDDGFYDTRSDEIFRQPLEILSCAGSSSGESTRASIIAELTSDVVAGGEMTVEATITNMAGEEATFDLSVLGYQSWAELDSISSESFTLAAGESMDIEITLNIDEDATGEQTFTIRTLSDGKIDSREVSVNLEETTGTGPEFTGFSIGDLGSGGYAWLLVLVNVILIILVIIVAVRLSRR